MRKFLRTILTLGFFFVFLQAKAQITIGTVDVGPYGFGSNITVPISFPSNISDLPINNTFELFLSDANGNFVGNGTSLGTFSGFYTPAINGTIPAGLAAGTGYKLRVRMSNPNNVPVANIIDLPGNITIVAQTSPTVTLTPNSPANSLGGDNIGFCPTDAGPNKSLLLKDNVPASTVIEIQVKNMLTNVVTVYTETTLPAGYNITNLSVGFYTVTSIATTVVNGVAVKSIKSYVLHNTTFGIGITDNGATAGCINGTGGGASVSYNITGVTANYPGTTYRVSWGDGSNEELTLAQINNNGGAITHSFTETSCGKGGAPDGSNNNSFQVTITSVSVTCGVTKPVTAYAQVFLNPVAKITGSPIGCVNIPMTFTNASLAGTRSDCTDRMDYSWYVDGGTTPVQISTSNEPLLWTFTTPGNNHSIRLVASNGVGVCDPSEFTFAVCIQEPPRPSFTLPGTAPITICSNSPLTPTNTSFIDQTCSTVKTYRWIVDIITGGGQVAFGGGTSLSSENPQFIFPTPGIYDISLAIPTAACGEVITAKQRVIVNTTPTATLSANISLCSPGAYLFSNVNTSSPTYTTVSGTFSDLPETYTWTITGGSYTITDNNLHTKYPTITFADFATYTITLSHTNNCGTTNPVATQVINFIPSPTIDLGPDQNICFTDKATLNAVITGAYTTAVWSGGTASGFSTVNGPNTIYTPSAQEKAAGQVTLTLTITTNLAPPCQVITKTILIKIKPEIKITSATTAIICTGTVLNYTPTSNLTNTTYTYTATGTPNAGNYTTASPTPAIVPIADNLTNSDPLNNATVTYLITPYNDGCPGAQFTLVVTITPRPIIATTVPEKTICSNSSAAISVTSNIPTTFSWTATATNGVTGFAASGAQAPIGTTLAINEILVNTGAANGNVQGTVTYVITPISPSGCPGNPITVIVHVDPAVTIANAGLDEDICSTSTYLLKGNALKPGETGLWTLSPTPAHAVTPTFSDATTPGTTVNNLTPGENYIFIWTITGSGSCGSTTDQVAINVNMPTIPGTTSTATASTVCQGANTGTIILNGSLGSVLRWESSTDGGTTWVTAVNTTTTNTYTYSNITVSTQYRAVVQNGQCAIGNSTATAITVTPADTRADAGIDRILCNETTVTLQGNTNLRAGIETGLWTLVPATSANPTVTFADATNPNTLVTGLIAGQTYTFRWTVTGPSACGPTTDDVVITNLRPIANNIISSTSALVCSGQTITITGLTPTGGTGTYTYTWESSTDGGATWSTIVGQTDQNLNFNILVTTRFRRNVSSATCPSVSNEYNIVAQPPITNNTVAADQTICTGIIPAVLTGTAPQGSDGNFNYQWQFSIDGGTTWANVEGAVRAEYQPPALTATTLYRRIVSTVTCNGAQSNTSPAITITVKPNAKADFTWTKDKDCSPFVLNTSIITTKEYPDRNDTYTWFANNVQIGTGAAFPGYTITNSNESVTIKLVVTPSTGCQSDELSHVFSTNQAATATYTQSTTQGCGPLLVTFVNTSASLADATFRWDFGNGTTSSAAQPAAVTYLSEPTGKDTTYTVTLTATTSCGVSTTTSTVLVKAKPISRFSPSRTEGCSPMRVTFSNTSPGGTNTYYYDFGDGTLLTKTDKSTVEHTYVVTATTDFTVKMIAENECGRDESSYVLRVSPQNITPELVVNANEKQGCAPLTVNFINNSIGASRFTFDFGDGGTLNTVTTGTVQHTFTRAGTFTITMTAFNSCSEVSTTETVTVLPQPVAAFDADVTLGCPGLPVQFRNTTQDGFSYLWDFGDGTTSDEFEPKHVYTGDQEYYTVTLTATNTQGCKISLIRNQYIHTVQPPVAKFNVNPSILISIPNYTFRFEDESTNMPTVWAWDFGDGVKSTLQNPSHTYLDTGSYVVTLRVTNQQGCFTTTFKTVRIVGVPGYLYVPNSFMPGSETPELRVFMAKGSGIKSWTMSVFNKWGQTLWQTSKLDEGRPVEWWDGTFNSIPQPQGVFFWKIDVEFINGTEWKGMTYDSKSPKKTGVIHLLR